jgi:hypothetical protein
MQQSSHLSALLPACLLIAAGAAVIPTEAALGQDRYRVLQQENFRREGAPSGRLLGSVFQGTEVRGGQVVSGWVEVTLEGWIWGQSLRRVQDGTFDYEVSASNGENLRLEPNGSVLSRLDTGFLLEAVETGGAWVRVRRTGWMWGRSLERVQGGAPRVDPPDVVQTSRPPQTASAGGEAGLDRAVAAERARLRAVPDGDSTATLAGDAPLRILTRSGEWVRVQMEGWVHESDLRPVSGDVLVGVSGGEVRARPEEFEGRLLQWTLQFVSLQTSDGLRQEIPDGQPYMLARGPVPEAGFVYVLLNATQAAEVERMSALVEIVMLVRVRVGRSRYLANPVVELVEMSMRGP